MKIFKKPGFSRARTISDGDDADLPEITEADMTALKQQDEHSSCDRENTVLCCRVVVLCICWYTVSSTNNIIGKVLLTYFPYPVTATLFQLVCTAIFSHPLAVYWKVPKVHWKQVGWYYYATMIIPLAFGKFIAAVSAHISIWKVSISYAHTVKASMPIFVVFLSRILLHETQTYIVYFSLTPIVAGVVIATLTELNFDASGLSSALTATFAFSLQNVFSKKCLKETKMHHIRLLLILARLSSLLFFPVWLVLDVRDVSTNWAQMANTDWMYVGSLLLLDGFLNFTQNLIAFTMIALVTPLSYAVANASKRIAIIFVSLLVLKNPVTSTNCFGMGLSVFGVLLYNKAKYDQNRQLQREKILPMVKSDAALTSVHCYGDSRHRLPTVHSSVTLSSDGNDNNFYKPSNGIFTGPKHKKQHNSYLDASHSSHLV